MVAWLARQSAYWWWIHRTLHCISTAKERPSLMVYCLAAPIVSNWTVWNFRRRRWLRLLAGDELGVVQKAH